MNYLFYFLERVFMNRLMVTSECSKVFLITRLWKDILYKYNLRLFVLITQLIAVKSPYFQNTFSFLPLGLETTI